MGVLVDTGMAIQSKSFDIWRRLYTRFQLEPGPSVIGGLPEVSTSVIPVTQVDDLLREGRALIGNTVDLSGGGSLTIACHTVPSGQRWNLFRAWRTTTAAGTRIRIADPRNDDIILTIAGTAEEVVNFGAPFVLEEGWIIGLQETGNGSDIAEQVHILITAEDAF